MTLMLERNLDLFKMYYHTNNKVSRSTHSKVIAQTDTQTDTQTEIQADRN